MRGGSPRRERDMSEIEKATVRAQENADRQNEVWLVTEAVDTGLHGAVSRDYFPTSREQAAKRGHTLRVVKHVYPLGYLPTIIANGIDEGGKTRDGLAWCAEVLARAASHSVTVYPTFTYRNIEGVEYTLGVDLSGTTDSSERSIVFDTTEVVEDLERILGDR